jgi:hypothetical protein
MPVRTLQNVTQVGGAPNTATTKRLKLDFDEKIALDLAEISIAPNTIAVGTAVNSNGTASLLVPVTVSGEGAVTVGAASDNYIILDSPIAAVAVYEENGTKLFLTGYVKLGGKLQTNNARLGYTVRADMDADVKVDLVDLETGNALTTGTISTGAVAGTPNYKLQLTHAVLAGMDLTDDTRYVLRFTRAKALGSGHDESYLTAEILLDLTDLDILDTINPLVDLDEIEIRRTQGTPDVSEIVLVPGSFVLPAATKGRIEAADALVLKALVGMGDTDLQTNIYNMNEYLGVDAADYAIVQGAIGRIKNVGTLKISNTDANGIVYINTTKTTW